MQFCLYYNLPKYFMNRVKNMFDCVNLHLSPNSLRGPHLKMKPRILQGPNGELEAVLNYD